MSAPRLPRATAFTLIELLVVVGIITILAAMLLPVLSRAKESSKRTLCLSQLKHYGLAMAMYLDEHEGNYPMPYSKNGWGGPDWFNPIYISVAGPNYPDAPGGHNGTALFVFEQFGLPRTMLSCPSRPLSFPPYQDPFVAWNAGMPYRCWGGDWGCSAPIGYVQVHGFNDENQDNWLDAPYVGWANWRATGVAVPAYKKENADLSAAVVTADAVAWEDWWGSKSPTINHVSPDNAYVAVYQNMLFGDGHGEGRADRIYVADPNDATPYLGFTTKGNGPWHRMFWGKSR